MKSFKTYLSEGAGLWANIHKKRKSGKRMRKPGEKGAPTKADFKRAKGEEVEEAVKYMNMNQLKKELKKEYGAKASTLKIVKIKGGVSIQTPGGQELERYNNVPKLGFTVSEGKGPPESFEAQFKRRVVATTKPEHKEKGYKWRIKGKDRPNISIKLYKSKPDFAEFKKQLKRVAGHEFG
jgi:hypothetical protein